MLYYYSVLQLSFQHLHLQCRCLLIIIIFIFISINPSYIITFAHMLSLFRSSSVNVLLFFNALPIIFAPSSSILLSVHNTLSSSISIYLSVFLSLSVTITTQNQCNQRMITFQCFTYPSSSFYSNAVPCSYFFNQFHFNLFF